MRILTIVSAFLMIACQTHGSDQTNTSFWLINSLYSIAGLPTHTEGNPQLMSASQSLKFDGDGDRLVVDKNPLAGAEEFTIEIILKPYDVYPNNLEPRFFHIESSDNHNRRVTVELRLNNKKQWYLDAYIKSDSSQLTLIDSSKVHPVNQWVHVAVTYKNKIFVSYVNGNKELAGVVEFLPIPDNAKTSIGARMNRVHWFNGEIRTVRVSQKALSPESFLTIGNT